MATRRRTFVLVVLTLMGCRPSLRVPGTARLACASNDDCPGTFECNPDTQMCVDLKRRDRIPPHVVADSVWMSTTVLGETGILEVRFTVDEPLARDPVVSLAGQQLAIESADGETYSFRYVADGSASEGPAEPITAFLVDMAGNSSPEASVGFVGFDYTAPLVNDITLTSESLARNGDTVSVRITLDDGAAVVTSVELLGNLAPFQLLTSAPPIFDFSLVLDDTTPEGPQGIHIGVRDPAGNVSESTKSGLFVFDSLPPALAGPLAVTLVPDPNSSPLAVVSAARDGTEVHLGFAVDESLGAAPTVLARAYGDAASELDFTLLDSSLLSYEYVATVPIGLASDTYAVEIDARDLAGNEAILVPSTGFVVDEDAPAAPDSESDPSPILLDRKPWGTATSPATARLMGAAQSAPGGSTVIAYSAATPPRIELGRTTVAVDGSFDLSLSVSDSEHVFVVAADAAGNASPAVEAKEGVYHATITGRVADSSNGNPNIYTLVSSATGALEQLDGQEADGSLLGSADGNVASVYGTGSVGTCPRHRTPRA